MSYNHGIVFEWDGERPLTEDIPRPVSAAKMIPEWYQKIPTHAGGGSTVKLCASFSDALRMGWIIPLPFDMSVACGDDGISCVIPGVDVAATTYGPSTPEFAENSSFRKPELKIPNPWKIHTPDGYSTLVTYPRNRENHGVKPYSMLVDTDTYDGPINIPASTTQPRADISAGVPFLHVLPLKRDAVISEFDVTSESESPDLWEIWDTTHLRTYAEKGYYRRYCWEPKENASTVDKTGDFGDGDPDTTPQINDLVGRGHSGSETPEPTHRPKLVISDELAGIAPEPFSNSDPLPRWITDSDAWPVNGADEQRIREWARSAMDLGWNIPVVADTYINVDGGNVELHSDFDGQYKRGEMHRTGPSSIHPPKQIGDKYSSARPSVGKITSPWFTCTPPGYSVLHCEPFNHWQQYHRSYSGIVDSDRFVVDANLLGKIDLPDGEYHVRKGQPAVMQMALHRDSMLTNGYIVSDYDEGTDD